MKTIFVGLFAVALWAQYVPPGGGGGAPSGAAGGSLAGTYPNPTIGTLGQNLLFTDATYDIGASGATRPRDIFTSRDMTVGRNLTVGAAVLNVPLLSTPSAPSLSTAGIPGSTSYSYQVSATTPVGATLGSSAATIATGNATLGVSNYVIITPVACATGQNGWNIFRSASGGSPSGTGYIATIACGANLHDTGLSVPSVDGGLLSGPYITPRVNTTQGQYLANNVNIQGLLSVGNVAGFQDQYVEQDGGPIFFNSAHSFDGGNAPVSFMGANIYQSYKNINSGSVIGLQIILDEASDNAQATTNPEGLTVWTWKESNTATATLDGIVNFPEIDAGTVTDLRALYTDTFISSGATVGTLRNTYSRIQNRGTISGNTYHYLTETETGTYSGNVYGYYSDLNAATGVLGTFAFYGAGTAASLLNGPLTLNGNVVNPLQFSKNTQLAAAPGAGKCDLRWIAGTNAGTGKLVAACGTSATEVTVIDNVGAAF